jgi:preprotein translocase subunit SecD
MNTTKQMIRVAIMSMLFVACGASEKIVSFKKKSSETGIYEFDPNGVSHKVLDNDSTTYTLKSKPSIPIEKFQLLEISDECYAGEICVDFKLNKEGTKEYTALTKRNLNNIIFYVIDGVIISDPYVMGVINVGSGQFGIKEKYFDSLFVVK